MTPERWRKIEEVYHAAVGVSGDERAAYLKEACADDSDLRREVESLLAQAKTADSFLESPAFEATAKTFHAPQGQSFIGRQMGPYQVISLIGAGGMGEVYEALDAKLRRKVAIKILPAAFLNDPERSSRFQREARMLASLNHPNIATIYGFEQSDGVQYLVMELVPGQTLAERVTKGALPLEEALKVAGQIAEGLEAAHEQGVIHRDLKPANVKVTPEGRVKVLDFGLAKAFAGLDGPDLSNVATLTVAGTEEGKILGTPSYMSPEQARGQPVDKRTDNWAFGCVFYEMLTGRQAFAGKTLTDTLAAVLEREPDWQALPASTPAKLRDLLRRCLLKDSRRRLRDIGDARIELEEALSSYQKPAAATHPAATVKAATGRRKMRWAGAALATLVLVGLAIWALRPSARAPLTVSRVASVLPPGQLVAGLEAGLAIAVSPDGAELAYIARQGGTQQLYLRPLGTLEGHAVPGSDGAIEPFFSPDGRWVGFFAGGKLKKAPVGGGEAISLADAIDPRGGTWGKNGTIIFAPTRASILQSVPEAGGAMQAVTKLQGQENAHRWPELLPDGQTLLFAAGGTGRNWDGATIVAQSLASGERRDLIKGGTHPRYASSGQLVYARDGDLLSVGFDPNRLMITGRPVTVLEGVVQAPLTGAAQYSISTNGTLTYIPASAHATQRNLVWVSRNGAEQALAGPPRAFRQPRISPDGHRVAVAIEEEETQVWLYDLTRDVLTRLTVDGKINYNPVWTPDGARVVYQSLDRLNGGLAWQSADGSGVPQMLSSNGVGNPGGWTPDGQALVGTMIPDPNLGLSFDIYLLRRGDSEAKPFIATRFNVGGPAFSPDGRWLAYVSDETGRYQIYVSPYPGPGGKFQVSTEGGMEPVWNRNGRELFFRNGDKMMAVEIATGASFTGGKPRMLFQGEYQPNPTMAANYDISPDGQRFLMVKPAAAQQSAPTQINVVLNWIEELRRLAPAGKGSP